MPSRRAVIVHVGIMGDRPGGIAQVVNQYLTWHSTDTIQLGIPSTRGRRDILSPVLWLLALVRLFAVRIRYGRAAVLVHLSANGSFVREGSLVLWARVIGHRLGIHLHGSRFPDFAAKHPQAVSLVCGASHKVFALTDESAAILEAVVQRGLTRIIRINNVVEVPIELPPKEEIVLFGGELGRRKGIDILLDAWDSLGPRRGRWQLVLAGPVSPEMRGDLPRKEGVHVLGSLPHEELLDLQGRAAIATLPSRNEALPMFLLESMARGCAVIATDVGQVRELIQDVGELITAGDATGLADSMSALMSNDQRRQQMGSAAQSRIVDRYSVQATRELLEREWLELALGSAKG